MAASTLTTVNFNNSSDTNFRAWVAAIISAIVAGGWIQTSDTGQINTSTVTAPAAINTVQGYAIFRSNDTGGSLVEYYVKLEFGSGAASARPAVWITVGWASDGAGNLVFTTYPVSARTQVASGATPAGASISINMAAGSGYFCICATSSLVNEHVMFAVERTINTSLVFQNQISILGTTAGSFANTGGGGLAQVIDRLNAFPANPAGIGYAVSMPPVANSPIGGVVALGLVFGLAPGATSPSLNIFGVEDTALGVYQDTVTVPVLGSNHNYKIQRTMNISSIGSTVILSRYE